MKSRDELINYLLEMIDDMALTIEDNSVIETDFETVLPYVEQLKEEVISLSETE
jgi:hypothetical protein